MDRNENGTITKGTILNPIGRPKGSINTSTKEIREFYADFLNDNKEKIKTDFENLESKDRLKFIIEISKFVIPTLKSIDAEINIEPIEPKKIIFEVIRNKSEINNNNIDK